MFVVNFWISAAVGECKQYICGRFFPNEGTPPHTSWSVSLLIWSQIILSNNEAIFVMMHQSLLYKKALW